MLAAAIFDLDGTLIDSVDSQARAWSEAFARYGYDVGEAQARSQIGKGGDMLLPTFLDEAAIARHGDALKDAQLEIYRASYRDGVRPFPKVREFFEALHARGVKIGLATSSQKKDLDVSLKRLGVKHLIQAITCSEDVGTSKPAPDIFEVAATRLGPLALDRALGFGDSPWDALSATRMGLRMVGLRCGGFDDQTLRDAGATWLYDSPAALLADLDTLLNLV